MKDFVVEFLKQIGEDIKETLMENTKSIAQWILTFIVIFCILLGCSFLCNVSNDGEKLSVSFGNTTQELNYSD